MVGGGLTGVELASELGEQRRGLRVTLLASGEVGFMVSTAARSVMRETLGRLGVEICEHARVVAVEKDGVVLESGAVVPNEITIWCGGLAPTPLAARHRPRGGRARVAPSWTSSCAAARTPSCA